MWNLSVLLEVSRASRRKCLPQELWAELEQAEKENKQEPRLRC